MDRDESGVTAHNGEGAGEDLLPCHACGSEARLLRAAGLHMNAPTCYGVGCKTPSCPMYGGTGKVYEKEIAVRKWNLRYKPAARPSDPIPPPTAQGIREANPSATPQGPAPLVNSFEPNPVGYEFGAPASQGALTPPSLGPTFDFIQHLYRQREFSRKTFGPGARAAGVVAHIRKELAEIEASPGDLEEWIDVAILALDGAWRTGAAPQEIIDQLVRKQDKNESRDWPDWRTQPTDAPIEHVRPHEPREGQSKSFHLLYWLMGELADRNTPDEGGYFELDHECEFHSNPEKGACDFCDKWAELFEHMMEVGAPGESREGKAGPQDRIGDRGDLVLERDQLRAENARLEADLESCRREAGAVREAPDLEDLERVDEAIRKYLPGLVHTQAAWERLRAALQGVQAPGPLQWTKGYRLDAPGQYWWRMPGSEPEVLSDTELAKIYAMVPIGEEYPFEIAGPIPEPGQSPGRAQARPQGDQGGAP